MTCDRMIGPYQLNRSEQFVSKFWAKVQMNGPLCWDWMAAKGDHGYGIIMDGRKALLAHRVAFELTGHMIGAGQQIDHLCKNRGCVNPKHLQAVSPAENNRRSNSKSAQRSRMTCCPKCGGEYTRMSTGERRCIPCRLARRRERYAAGERGV